MKRNIVDVYLQLAISFEEQGRVDSANYALERAIEVDSQKKHIL